MARSLTFWKNQTFVIALLLALTLTLSACGGTVETVPSASTAPTVAVDAPAPTVATTVATTVAPSQIPAEAPTEAPAAQVAPTPSPTQEAAPAQPTDWTQTVTREGDYYVLGNPAAPIRLLDYSDFL